MLYQGRPVYEFVERQQGRLRDTVGLQALFQSTMYWTPDGKVTGYPVVIEPYVNGVLVGQRNNYHDSSTPWPPPRARHKSTIPRIMPHTVAINTGSSSAAETVPS